MPHLPATAGDRAQRGAIHLRVDRRGQGASMTEQLPDFGERRAGAEQLAGRGMAEPVRMDHPEAGPPSRRGDDLGHPARAETLMRRAMRTKTVRSMAVAGRARRMYPRSPRRHQPARAAIPPAAPCHESSSCRLASRCPRAVSAASSPARVPSRTSMRQHGIVAPSQSGAPITGRDEGVHRGRRESFGQSGQSPPGDRRDDSDE